MTTVIANGHTYTDNDDPNTGMGAGGFRTRLMPMLNDVMIDINAYLNTAAGSSGQAGTYAAQAQGYRDQASTYATNSFNSASASSVSASNASASATQAANSAAAAQAIQLVGTSTTSVAIGTGTKTFTTQSGKQWIAGTPIQATDSTNPANYVNGTVSSYSGTTLVIAVTNIGGSGTKNSWNISVVGIQGIQGIQGPGNAAGNAAGAINELKGTAPASSATPDIWGAGGNRVPISSATTITGFPAAPQAGSKRTLVPSVAFSMTASANLIIAGGSNLVNVGDEVDVVAETTTQFKASIRRGDGTATAPSTFRYADFYSTSAVIVVPRSGLVRLTMGGACGSGGLATVSVSSGSAAASGGSAGGLAIKTWYANAGDTIVLNLAAGGLGPSGALDVAISGNSGGNSTATGPGVSITVNGGLGGNAVRQVSSTSAAVAAGVAGGAASGGDINITGGASGTATAQTGSTSSGNIASAATGGGAVCYRQGAYKSGNANASTGVLTLAKAAASSGGAGAGGSSGDATASVTSSGGTGSATTAGGSSQAASATSSATNVTVNGVATAGSYKMVSSTPITLYGAGSAGQSLTTGFTAAAIDQCGSGLGAINIFAGGGGASIYFDINPTSLVLGGVGGFAGTSGTGTTAVRMADVAWGAGTGGIVSMEVGVGSSFSVGDAGSAFAIFEFN